MYHYFIILWTRIVFFISSVSLFAQAPDTLWTKTFGGSNSERGHFVQETSDNGYIIVSNTWSYGAGMIDIWMIKTDAAGDTLWTKIFGDSKSDRGYSVQKTVDGGYIIAGNTSSFGAGGSDVYLVKTDAAGDTMWTKTYGGGDSDYGKAIQQTNDSGYIIAGYTHSYGAGETDIYLIKTNAAGDTMWTKTYGGSEKDYGYSVQQTDDGGYIITGNTRSYNAPDIDLLLIKTDASGSEVWTKIHGGSGWDYGYSVRQTKDGGYIIAGNTRSYGAGWYDVWLIKTNSSGDTSWTKTFGGSYDEYGRSVLQTVDGGYIIAGNTSSFGAGESDAYLIKTNAAGHTMWTKTYGGSDLDYGCSIYECDDRSYIIAGWTESYGAGDEDVWLIKIAPDPDGIVQNEKINNPAYYVLHDNYPNPFNPKTVISYQLPMISKVELSIYNLLGQKVAKLVSEKQPAGYYKAEWDATGCASGLYFYRLESNTGFVQTKKLILLR